MEKYWMYLFLIAPYHTLVFDVYGDFTMRVFPTLPYSIIDRFALSNNASFDPSFLDTARSIDANIPSACIYFDQTISFEVF